MYKKKKTKEKERGAFFAVDGTDDTDKTLERTSAGKGNAAEGGLSSETASQQKWIKY